jgi:3-dehydroquinate synthase
VLAREPAALEALVTRCVRIKAATVAADERDAAGRLFLNYGHTLGHALERLDAFAGRSHGEAVAIGMVFAARLATARGLAGEDLTGRTLRVLSSLGLDTDGPLPPSHDILTAFRMDKKFHGGVRFVLLRGVGEPTIVEGVTEEELRAVLQEMGAAA